MPDSHKKEKEDKMKAQGDEEAPGDEIEMMGGTVKILLTDGRAIQVPVEKITFEPEKNQVNISEEMANTAIWKQLTANEKKEKDNNGVRERYVCDAYVSAHLYCSVLVITWRIQVCCFALNWILAATLKSL